MHSKGRGNAGSGWKHDLADCEGFGNTPGVDRSGAAGGDQRVTAKVPASFDGVHSSSGRHVLVDHTVDCRARLLDREVDAGGETFDCGVRGSGVQRHLAAQEEVRVEIPEQQVGIGHGRVGSSQAVARRPRVGSGAIRANLGQAESAHPRDAPAACADLNEVDDRGSNRGARCLS